MSRSQHIIAAGVKQEHHPLMSSETRIFFLGLPIPALFFPEFLILRLRESATRKMKSLRQFWDAQKLIQTCALGLFRKPLFHADLVSIGVYRSLRGSVWRFGDVCEVFRRREEEDPESAAAGGWCAGQSAVSADAAGQWTRPAGESEETISPSHPCTPLSFSTASVCCFSRVSGLAEQK